MAGKLEGQVAWVTGGASGMGEAIVRLFAREGAQVVVVDVQEEQGKEVVEHIVREGGQAIFSACDVSRGQEVERSIAETVAEFGGLQIVVNCAGIVHVGLLHEYGEEQWEQLSFDTAVHRLDALQFLVDTEGCDRVLLGSNFGGWDAEDGYRHMVEQLDISVDGVNAILGGNAKRIFNL